jgi:hypothetical protein
VERDTFLRHLLAASARSRDFATQYVTDEVPNVCRYLIDLGAPEPDRTRADGTLFPVASHRFGARTESFVGSLDAAGVVEFLWRDGSVPRWINIQAHSTDGDYTYLRLTYGTFESDDNRLYYRPGFSKILMHDLPPFQVVGPSLPPRWDDNHPEKFDLHWRLK